MNSVPGKATVGPWSYSICKCMFEALGMDDVVGGFGGTELDSIAIITLAMSSGNCDREYGDL